MNSTWFTEIGEFKDANNGGDTWFCTESPSNDIRVPFSNNEKASLILCGVNVVYAPKRLNNTQIIWTPFKDLGAFSPKEALLPNIVNYIFALLWEGSKDVFRLLLCEIHIFTLFSNLGWPSSASALKKKIEVVKHFDTAETAYIQHEVPRGPGVQDFLPFSASNSFVW